MNQEKNMWTKKEKLRATLWGVLILCVLVALAFGLYSIFMKVALSNENQNLAIEFDEYGYTKRTLKERFLSKRIFRTCR